MRHCGTQRAVCGCAPRAFTARRRSGRADNRSELNRVYRHAGCLGTYGRREYTGLLLGLEHLNRDPVRVVDCHEVGADETGGSFNRRYGVLRG